MYTVMEMFDVPDIIWCFSLDIPPTEGSTDTLLECRTSSSHWAPSGSSALSRSQTSMSILGSVSQLSFFHCLNLEQKNSPQFIDVTGPVLTSHSGVGWSQYFSILVAERDWFHLALVN